MATVEFACPGCGRRCELDPERRALKHAVPACTVYEKTKADGQTFLRLAKQAMAPKSGKIERVN